MRSSVLLPPREKGWKKYMGWGEACAVPWGKGGRGREERPPGENKSGPGDAVLMRPRSEQVA